jgi:hypothetical protein
MKLLSTQSLQLKKGIMTLGSQFDFTPCSALLTASKEFERNRLHRHELWILTCYISLPVLINFLKFLKEIVRVTDCYLAFNFSEIFKQGPSATNDSLIKIEKWCKNNGINFEYRILLAGSLIHSKGYSIIQRVNDQITSGATLITSANFTDSGFFGKNIEFGYISTKKKDAVEFVDSYDDLWERFGKSSIDLAIIKEQNYLLKYSILASGVFLHKWSGSLSQLVGIKYLLTEEAKKRGSIAPELKALGFEAGDTFTRQVLPLREIPKKEIPKQFIESYAVETFWGRWCPIEAWNAVEQNFHGADPFISSFRNMTTPKKMNVIVAEAKKTQNRLIELGLVKEVSPDHIDRWEEKVINLRENENRLIRLFTGYDSHPLPYEFEHDLQVNELFDSLLETMDLSGKKSKVMTKVSSALKTGDIEDLNLSLEDLGQIKEMINN